MPGGQTSANARQAVRFLMIKDMERSLRFCRIGMDLVSPLDFALVLYPLGELKAWLSNFQAHNLGQDHRLARINNRAFQVIGLGL